MGSKEGQKPSIPKFGSFKPRSDAEQPDAYARKDQRAFGGRSNRLDTPRDPLPHEESKRGVENHEDRKSRGGDDSRRNRESYLIPSRHAPREPARNSVFFVDKRGDPLITRYGGNYRYDVPKYRRFGSGHILGAEGFLRFEQSGSRDVFSIQRPGEGGSLLRSDRKSVLARSGHTRSRPVRVRRENANLPMVTEDFLELRPSTKRKRASSHHGYSSDEDGPVYRSIKGKSKPHEHSDSDEIFDSDSSTGSLDQDRPRDPTVVKGMELSARVRHHPQDVDAWLDLVDHQDHVWQLGQQEHRQITPAEAKGHADVKLSILEKALTQVQKPAQRNRLLLRVMQEGSKIWDPKTLSKRWEGLMKNQSESFDLWVAYMLFRQTSLTAFRYDSVKQLYTERFGRLAAQMRKASAEIPVPQELLDELVALLLRATRFISDSGFAELAVAVWQATLELSFCRPSVGNIDEDAMLFSDFKMFWESEVQRVGEPSAKGWASFTANGGTEDAPEPRPAAVNVPAGKRNPYKAWAAIENLAVEASGIPARTMDTGADEDPYKVVMYADIEEFLILVPSQDLPRVQSRLLDAFVAFYQYLPASRYSGTGQDGLLDESDSYPFTIKGVEIRPADGASKTSMDVSQDHQRMAQSTQELCAPSEWFRYIGAYSSTQAKVAHSMVSNALRLLVLSYGRQDLGLYYLALEGAQLNSSIKKTAKALLKRYSGDIVLYAGYALLESAASNHASARNIVKAALGLPGLSPEDKLQLCISWAWIELEAGEMGKASSRLDIVADGSPDVDTTTPAQHLRTRQLFTTKRDYALSSRAYAHAISWAKGHALLEYLTGSSAKEPQSQEQGDIWAAVQSVSIFSQELAQRGLSKDPTHEELLQFMARLLYFHANRG
jgi:hypothetical protein